jgi:hypothetical protein
MLSNFDISVKDVVPFFQDSQSIKNKKSSCTKYKLGHRHGSEARGPWHPNYEEKNLAGYWEGGRGGGTFLPYEVKGQKTEVVLSDPIRSVAFPQYLLERQYTRKKFYFASKFRS